MRAGKICRIGARVLPAIRQHAVYIMLLLLGFGFIRAVHADYISADPMSCQGTEMLYLTKGVTVSIPFAPTSRRLHCVAIRLEQVSQDEPGVTAELSLLENGTVVSSQQFEEGVEIPIVKNGDDIYTELQFDPPYTIKKGASYEIQVTGNASSKETAFKVYLDQEGHPWYRVEYMWFERDQLEFGLFLLYAILVSALYFVLRALQKRQRLHWEAMYLLIAVPLFFLYHAALPIMQQPDFLNHYARIYGILKGQLLVPPDGMLQVPGNFLPYQTGDYTPCLLIKNYIAAVNPQVTELHNTVNMALYNPISYLFQCVGMGIGTRVSNNPYVWIYAGAAANYIGFMALISLAIRILPYGQRTVILLAFLPMTMMSGSGLSVDAVTIAVSVLLTAIVLRLRTFPQIMTSKEKAGVLLVLFLLASCKVLYFLIGLLALLIPSKCFASRKDAGLFKGAAAAVLFGTAIGWLRIAGGYLGQTQGGGTASEKVQFILHNPGRYLHVLNKTLWWDSAEYINQLAGGRMGGLTIIINSTLTVLILIVFLKIYFTENQFGQRKDEGFLWASAGLTVVITVLILTSIFIQWIDSDPAVVADIWGVQGRYFLPVLPMLLISIAGDTRRETTAGADQITAEQITQHDISAFCTVYALNILECTAIFRYFAV